MTPQRLPLVVVVVVVLLVVVWPIEGQTVGQDYQCDFLSFRCDERFLFNGICESSLFTPELNPCYGVDCIDCDPCLEFKADCQACTANGCVWCPHDAYCSSQPLGQNFWANFAKTSACAQESDWTDTCQPDAEAQSNNVFTDPLYSAQKWVYDLLNLEPAWRLGYTGKGVNVRVNDPHGVDATIPELAPNFDQASSCEAYMPPSIPAMILSHGTEVASIAVGRANNDNCAVGVAPEATLSACFGPRLLIDDEVARFFVDGFNKDIHISINSWGFDACRPVEDGQSNRNLRYLQHRCPFQLETIDNPCYHPACTLFNETICAQYTAEYCRMNFALENKGCAEYLDTFLSCEYNVSVQETVLSQGKASALSSHVLFTNDDSL
jgi:Subtilase family